MKIVFQCGSCNKPGAVVDFLFFEEEECEDICLALHCPYCKHQADISIKAWLARVFEELNEGHD